MAPRGCMHWYIPFLMVVTLISGILLALGHHAFYRSLDGTPTSTGNKRGFENRGQQFNTAVGTAFAFLVKSALVVSVTTAYYQLFWKTVRHVSKTPRPATLGWLDTAFSGPSKVISLLSLPVWFRYPLLFTTALSIWLIPIASIIAPATLSVALRENLATTSLQNVPQMDFDNLNFVAGMPGAKGSNGISLHYYYNGPSQVVQQTAMAVAAQNQILPIQPSHPNSTWSLTFHGPALRCEPLSSDQQLRFSSNIAQHLLQGENCQAPPSYLAWFPRLFNTSSNATYTEPYFQNPNSTWRDPSSIFKPGLTWDNNIKQDPTLYVVSMPQMLSVREYTLTTLPLACDLNSQSTDKEPLGSVGGNITMIQCKLYNSTYKTDFAYLNGQQNVQVGVSNDEGASTVPIIANVRGAGSGGLGSNETCATLNSETMAFGNPCFFDQSLLSQLSFQAILNAFSNLVTGNITLGDGISKGPLDGSRLRTTGLINTRELRYLTDYELHVSSTESYPDLQKSLLNSSMTGVSGMTRLRAAAGDKLLQDAIEEMFQNLTVSLMASSELQPNYTSSTAPPKSSVTTFTARTVYSYSAFKLWAAYGTASVVATLYVLLGLLTIFVEGASYESSFSTVFGVARGADMDVEVEDGDTDGKSPLPAYLEKASVRVRSRQSDKNEAGLLRRKRRTLN